MRILSRNIITAHPKDKVLNILSNSASQYWPIKVKDNYFTFKIKVSQYGRISFIPVRGRVYDDASFCSVQLEIHSNLSFYIGMLVSIIGMSHLMYNLIAVKYADFSAVVCLIFGLITYLWSLFIGFTCLKRLEHRLLD